MPGISTAGGALHRHRRHASRLSRDECFPTLGILDSGDELPTREQLPAISRVAAGLGRLFSDFALPGIGTIEVAIDWRVVLAVACLAVVAGTCAGVAPALLAVRESVTGALGRGSRTGPPRAGRLRHALAAVQVALSLTFLVGALLFLMTLRHLRSVDLGFDPAGVTLVTLNVRGYGYTDARAVEYLKQVADVVRRQPGIQATGLAFGPPLFGGGLTDGMYLPDQDPSQATNVERNGVSPDYFKAVRLPIVRGRVFTEAETSGNAETDRHAPHDELALLAVRMADATGSEREGG